MSKHKSVWLLCLALMLEIIAIGVLVPGDWTGRVISKEKQMIQNQLGAQTSYWIGQTSHRWYQSWIV
ncbi:conjugal transfer protein, partial [Vibrio anguillarum]|nr:conjugal transfer protein [Vibrio anguillarum]